MPLSPWKCSLSPLTDRNKAPFCPQKVTFFQQIQDINIVGKSTYKPLKSFMILWPNHLCRITTSEVANLFKIPSVKQTKWKLSWWKTYLSLQNTRADERCLLFLHSFFKLLCINIWQYLCHNSNSWYLQRNLHPYRTRNASVLKFLCIHTHQSMEYNITVVRF